MLHWRLTKWPTLVVDSGRVVLAKCYPAHDMRLGVCVFVGRGRGAGVSCQSVSVGSCATQTTTGHADYVQSAGVCAQMQRSYIPSNCVCEAMKHPRDPHYHT